MSPMSLKPFLASRLGYTQGVLGIQGFCSFQALELEGGPGDKASPQTGPPQPTSPTNPEPSQPELASITGVGLGALAGKGIGSLLASGSQMSGIVPSQETSPQQNETHNTKRTLQTTQRPQSTVPWPVLVSQGRKDSLGRRAEGLGLLVCRAPAQPATWDLEAYLKVDGFRV